MGEARRRKLEARRRQRKGLSQQHVPEVMLHAFLTVWRHGVRGVPRGGCIPGSRIAAEVWKRLGYTAEPISVWIEISRMVNPTYVVGISPEMKKSPFYEIINPGGQWYGHIVLRVTGNGEGPWLVDVVTGQFDSPKDRIQPAPVLGMDWPEIVAPSYEEVRFQAISRDLFITYWKRDDDEDNSWRDAWNTVDISGLNLDGLAAEVQRLTHDRQVRDLALSSSKHISIYEIR